MLQIQNMTDQRGPTNTFSKVNLNILSILFVRFHQQLTKDDSVREYQCQIQFISPIKKTAFNCILHFQYYHPIQNNLQPLQLGKINSFKYCLTLFLLVSTMSVIKLLSHIIFFERERGMGIQAPLQYHFPPLYQLSMKPERITNPVRFNYSLTTAVFERT